MQYGGMMRFLSSLTRQQALGIVVALFAVSRLVLFWVDREAYLTKFPFQDDAPAYWQLAQIWSGQGSAEQFDRSPFTRVPLYPLFLILFMGADSSLNLPALFFVQQLLLLVVIMGVFWFIQRRHGVRVGFTMAAALTLFFDFTLYGFLVRSEALFTLLVFGAVMAVLRFWRTQHVVALAAAGGLFGLATLTRPVAFFVFGPVLLTVAAAVRYRQLPGRRALIGGGVFLIVFAAVLSPWLLRNWRLSGSLVLQQDTGNLIYATFPGGHWQSVDVHSLIDTAGKSELTVDRELTALAMQRIVEQPSVWIRNTLKNFLFRLWSMGFADTHLRYFDYAADPGGYHQAPGGLLGRLAASLRVGSEMFTISPAHHAYLLLNNALGFSLVFLVLICLTVWPLLPSESRIVFGMLLYFWLITSLFAFSGSRYMVPMVPLLFLVLPDVWRLASRMRNSLNAAKL